jgi:3-deoxy-D-manno-octulosonic-acid transferase
MVHGNPPALLWFLGTIWSYVLLLIRPIIMLFSAKFREREQGVLMQHVYRRIPCDTLSVWIHASSLGEFEQARPIIDAMKKKNPSIDVTVTFFSPSGYRIRHAYEFADRVLYLPIDSSENASSFLNRINPDVILFIRYELWMNYLLEARKLAIPVYAVNATFPSSWIWKFFPWLLRSILDLFSGIYAVNSTEMNAFKALHPSVSIYDGNDTRIDRIHEQVSAITSNQSMIEDLLPGIEHHSMPCIVLGSSWTEDEAVFLSALSLIDEPLRLIIVPHEPTIDHCKAINESLPNSMLLSECEDIGNQHIIVDSIGNLLAIYAIADAAYIGGGFGAGVHSCAEPAGYGIPLASGPHIARSPDANILHQLGALEIIGNEHDAARWLKAICAGLMDHAGEASKEYIQSRRGMTEIILRDIIGLND